MDETRSPKKDSREMTIEELQKLFAKYGPPPSRSTILELARAKRLKPNSFFFLPSGGSWIDELCRDISEDLGNSRKEKK